MKVTVNDKCIGCRICEGVCPQGFKVVNGKSVVQDPNAPCVKKAAESCPVGAIEVEE